jgi:hypothetical protein
MCNEATLIKVADNKIPQHIIPSVSVGGRPPTKIFLVLKSLGLDCIESFGMVLFISTWKQKQALPVSNFQVMNISERVSSTQGMVTSIRTYICTEQTKKS